MLGTIVPSILDSSLFIPDLKVRRKESALGEMADCAHRAGAVRRAESLRDLLIVREAVGITSPGRGIAVPGVRSLLVTEVRVVVARSRRGIEWGAGDGVPVQLVFLALSPAVCSEGFHLEMIARIVAAVRPQRNRQKLLDASGFEPFASMLRDLIS